MRFSSSSNGITDAALAAPWEGNQVSYNPLPDPLDNDDDLVANPIQSNKQDTEDGDLISIQSRIEHMAIVSNSSPHSTAVVAPTRLKKEGYLFLPCRPTCAHPSVRFNRYAPPSNCHRQKVV